MTSVDAYPLPAHAASIWAAGDKFYLGLPPTDEHSSGHSVAFEINEGFFAGLAKAATIDSKDMDIDCRKSLRAVYMLLHTLRERASAVHAVGSASNPTQWDLHQAMKNFEGTITRIEKGKRAAQETLTLEDLDL